MWEFERCWVDRIRFTSTHNSGFGINLLERDQPHFFAGVVLSQRRRAGVGLLIAPLLFACVLEFSTVDKRIAFLYLQVREQVLTVFCTYGINSS